MFLGFFFFFFRNSGILTFRQALYPHAPRKGLKGNSGIAVTSAQILWDLSVCLCDSEGRDVQGCLLP